MTLEIQSTMTADELRRRGADDEDRAYDALLEHVMVSVDVATEPLFTTDAMGLYDLFLKALPADRRQHYECRTCRRFVDRFGGLVSAYRDSPIWTPSIESYPFHDAVRAIRDAVSLAKVTGVFLSSEYMWGTGANLSPRSPNGMWRHLHIVPDAKHVYQPTTLSAEQAMAEKQQDYQTLSRALADFSIDTVRGAYLLLTTGQLYRSEKCIGVAKWLLELHEAIAKAKHKYVRENLVWRAVATAPPGFCHVRTTMIGTLLEDIAAGKRFEDIKRAFDSKMNPAQYQRPTAAPTDGQLAEAEKVVAKLGAEGSLARRYARLEEIAPHAVWLPKPDADIPGIVGSIFGHLKSKAIEAASIDVPRQDITWEKFKRTVLPEAEKAECFVPMVRDSFFAFVTAENPNAPPILQWDRVGARNPVSWYLHLEGSLASDFGVTAGSYCEVTAITEQPSSWNGAMEHQGNGVYFVLKGARDRAQPGLALFPEILKTEYRGIRAAMEAYSNSKTLGGIKESSACGLACRQGPNKWNRIVRVTTKGMRAVYLIDRWD